MTVQIQAKIFRGTPKNIVRLAAVLNRGELVAVPTETVYGLAGDALDPSAVEKIFQAKGRPANDPLIVHIHTLAQLHTLADTNPSVTKLARAFWPGPLTLVLPKKSCVPDLVTSGRPSVAVRMPSHPVFRKLLRASGRPLAAPSANPFGYVSPTTAQHVFEGIGHEIRHILDGGACTIGVESTILDVRDPSHPAILRPGAIERDAIEKVLGVPVKLFHGEKVATSKAAVAPGMLARHYSPRTPMELVDTLPYPVPTANPGEAFLFFAKPAAATGASRPRNVFWLSKNGSLKEAAKALFATLRALDKSRWSLIRAERAPGGKALAVAINDRLTRAAAKR